ncbi:MAG TPA: hypothetical protein VEH04_17065 [Verrucomicrobiae bacterium]|nr:hypothetical protein [Verrucomicrobiae bacterium]
MKRDRRLDNPGRPKKDNKKVHTTISVRPSTLGEKGEPGPWAVLAKKAGVSKGHLVEWLVQSPDAEDCRKLAIKKAKYFVIPD